MAVRVTRHTAGSNQASRLPAFCESKVTAAKAAAVHATLLHVLSMVGHQWLLHLHTHSTLVVRLALSLCLLQLHVLLMGL